MHERIRAHTHNLPCVERAEVSPFFLMTRASSTSFCRARFSLLSSMVSSAMSRKIFTYVKENYYYIESEEKRPAIEAKEQ